MHWFIIWLLAVFPLSASSDVAGEFDYYVLSLSWSPNWCATEGDARRSDQCDPRHDHGWIMHGLWPQYERGYPQFCQTSMKPPSRRMTRDMADVMGTAGLAWHQWKKHGTCSGMPAEDYFALSRQSFEKVNRPAVLRKLTEAIEVAPSVIQDAFMRANPALKPDQITITCKTGYIQEARICLSKNLEPRKCGQDVIKDCTDSTSLFTPIR